MAEAGRVDLAHEPDFILGRLSISPVRRELARDDGAREVIEHKVMQVLIALAKAEGAVVTRDELTRSCWDGRIVGEDAINRVISRLRKSAEGIGQGSFRIETVTKIGYRLVGPDGSARRDEPAFALASKFSRRAVIAGAASAGVAGLAFGGFLLQRRISGASVPPEFAVLEQQAQLAMAQSTREGQNQAIGAYRRMTEIAPQSADAWGMLSAAYAWSAIYRSREEVRALHERSLAAARRSFAIDSGNSYAKLAAILTMPHIGHWGEIERGLRRVLAERQDDILSSKLAIYLCEVGRFEEAWALIGPIRSRPLSPTEYFQNIQILWCARRIDELDRTISEAIKFYPTHFAVWFSRFYIALHDGRAAAAVAQAEDLENRPTGIPTEELDEVLAVARAARSRDAGEIAAVMDRQMQNARSAAGKAENAIQFACLFGRLDEAFAIADAYYFERGFVVPDVRFSVSQGSYLLREYRNTRFLFAPSTRALRADPRFLRLTEELGLERYWREAGALPDYRRV